MNQIAQVLQYYNGFDISDIERTIVEVQETVAQINMSLNAIMPNESVPDTVKMILSEVTSLVVCVGFILLPSDQCCLQ